MLSESVSKVFRFQDHCIPTELPEVVVCLAVRASEFVDVVILFRDSIGLRSHIDLSSERLKTLFSEFDDNLLKFACHEVSSFRDKSLIEFFFLFFGDVRAHAYHDINLIYSR